MAKRIKLLLADGTFYIERPKLLKRYSKATGQDPRTRHLARFSPAFPEQGRPLDRVLADLLQAFNDYDVPLTMTAGDVRQKLIDIFKEFYDI